MKPTPLRRESVTSPTNPAPWSPVPLRKARKFFRDHPDAELGVVFPAVHEEDRSRVILDTSGAYNLKVISHKRMSERVARELGVEEYDYQAEQHDIQAEQSNTLINPPNLLGAGDALAAAASGAGTGPSTQFSQNIAMTKLNAKSPVPSKIVPPRPEFGNNPVGTMSQAAAGQARHPGTQGGGVTMKTAPVPQLGGSRRPIDAPHRAALRTRRAEAARRVLKQATRKVKAAQQQIRQARTRQVQESLMKSTRRVAKQTRRVAEALAHAAQTPPPAPNVVVHPPNITVSPPNVTVQPPNVTVEAPTIHVAVPAPKLIETKYQRDAKGLIERATQTPVEGDDGA